MIKESACNTGDWGSIPGSGRSFGGGNSYHSSILAWRIPWPEEPGGLQDTTEPLHTLTCVCKADSLYCTVETNNMVKQLHSNKD